MQTLITPRRHRKNAGHGGTVEGATLRPLHVLVRKIGSLTVTAVLILAVTGIGVWAASTPPHHPRAAHIQDSRAGTPFGGGLFSMPVVY